MNFYFLNCSLIMIGLATSIGIFSFLKKRRSNHLELRFFQNRKSPSIEQVFLWARHYGNNSNSFLGLYPGFKYFQSDDPKVIGAIPFASTGEAWVGVSVPLADPSQQSALIKAFAVAAQSVGKTAFLLPVDADCVRRAEEVGYGSLMIGMEPTFELNANRSFDLPTGTIQVNEFKPSDLSVSQKDQLDEILHEWISSRKMPLLRFLNRVEPWVLANEKRYFQVEQKGLVYAFIAAIPIWPRKGWYLIDVIRRSNIPAGTTDLLITEAMRLLKLDGAKVVTFGVAPFSGVDGEMASSSHPILNEVMKIIYKKFNFFYSFESLYRFKMKFNPTTNVPQYLIFYPKSARFGSFLGVLEAFVPIGMVKLFALTALKAVRRIQLDKWIKNYISDDVITRSAPQNWKKVLWRCKGALLLSCVYFLIRILNFFGVLEAAVISVELSTDFPIMGVGMLITCGLLEYLFGIWVLVLCFVPTMTLVGFGIKQYDLTRDSIFIEAMGVIAAGAGLSRFLKYKNIILIALIGIVILTAFVFQDKYILFGLGAILLGFFGSLISFRLRL